MGAHYKNSADEDPEKIRHTQVAVPNGDNIVSVINRYDHTNHNHNHVVVNNADNRVEQSEETVDYQTVADLWFTIFTTIFSIVDVGSDVYMAIYYLYWKWWFYFYLTIGFILFPSIITAVWYNYCNSRRLIGPEQLRRRVPVRRQISDFLLTTFLITPIIVNLEYLSYSLIEYYKTPNSVIITQRTNLTKRIYQIIKEAGIIKLIEAFLEAIPQVIIQIYIVYMNYGTSGGPFGGEIPWNVSVAILTSVGSGSLCILYAYKCYLNGSPLVEEPVTHLWSSCLFFSANLFLLCGRIAAIVLLLIFSPMWFLQFAVARCLILSIYSATFHTPTSDNALKNFVGSLGRSIGQLMIPPAIITYLDITEDGRVPPCYWIGYLFMLGENLGISSLWFIYSDQIGMIEILSLISHIFFAIGILMMYVHGKKFRPREILNWDKNLMRVEALKKSYKWMGLGARNNR